MGHPLWTVPSRLASCASRRAGRPRVRCSRLLLTRGQWPHIVEHAAPPDRVEEQTDQYHSENRLYADERARPIADGDDIAVAKGGDSRGAEVTHSPVAAREL